MHSVYYNFCLHGFLQSSFRGQERLIVVLILVFLPHPPPSPDGAIKGQGLLLVLLAASSPFHAILVLIATFLMLLGPLTSNGIFLHLIGKEGLQGAYT